MRALFILGLLILAGCAQDTQETTDTPEIADAQMPPFPPADDQGRPLITMADVEARNTQDECWTVVRGDVYDLTDWIRQHPGGARAIVNMCGTDATQAFEGQHGGNPSAENALENYRIGSVS